MDFLRRENRQVLLRKWEPGDGGKVGMVEGEKEEGRGGGRGNLRELNDWYGGRRERERKERDILIKGAIIWLASILALGKSSGILNDNSS